MKKYSKGEPYQFSVQPDPQHKVALRQKSFLKNQPQLLIMIMVAVLGPLACLVAGARPPSYTTSPKNCNLENLPTTSCKLHEIINTQVGYIDLFLSIIRICYVWLYSQGAECLSARQARGSERCGQAGQGAERCGHNHY